jgi:hypothetical protein
MVAAHARAPARQGPRHGGAYWVDGAVFDTDFVDPARATPGVDTSNFDRAGDAIAYFTGHGVDQGLGQPELHVVVAVHDAAGEWLGRRLLCAPRAGQLVRVQQRALARHTLAQRQARQLRELQQWRGGSEGCNFIMAIDSSQSRSQYHINSETWGDLTNDLWDAAGAAWFTWQANCNYNLAQYPWAI